MEKSQELIEIRVIEETTEAGSVSIQDPANLIVVQGESKEVINVTIGQDISQSTTSALEIGTSSVNVVKSSGNKSNKAIIPTRPILPISTTSHHHSTVIQGKYGKLLLCG